VFIAIIVVFFALALGYTRAIDRGLGSCDAAQVRAQRPRHSTGPVYLVYALPRPEQF
jgi:hypothetical protein